MAMFSGMNSGNMRQGGMMGPQQGGGGNRPGGGGMFGGMMGGMGGMMRPFMPPMGGGPKRPPQGLGPSVPPMMRPPNAVNTTPNGGAALPPGVPPRFQQGPPMMQPPIQPQTPNGGAGLPPQPAPPGSPPPMMNGGMPPPSMSPDNWQRKGPPMQGPSMLDQGASIQDMMNRLNQQRPPDRMHHMMQSGGGIAPSWLMNMRNQGGM